MIICKPSDRVKLEVVYEFYSEENDSFFKDIHKRHGNKWECIEDTCESIDDSSVIYEVYDNSELAAFFIRFKDNYRDALEGFHVKKKYRNAQFLKQFSEVIKMKFDDSFFTGIYFKNKPALNFLDKMGMKIINEVKHKEKLFYILKY